MIDASGKIVVPGGIEPHAHVGGPRQPERSGAEPVSQAAVWGGTTTVLDFATQVPGHDLRHALDEAAERWEGSAYTDYSYHPIFTNGADRASIDQSQTSCPKVSPASRYSRPRSVLPVPRCRTTRPTSDA